MVGHDPARQDASAPRNRDLPTEDRSDRRARARPDAPGTRTSGASGDKRRQVFVVGELPRDQRDVRGEIEDAPDARDDRRKGANVREPNRRGKSIPAGRRAHLDAAPVSVELDRPLVAYPARRPRRPGSLEPEELDDGRPVVGWRVGKDEPDRRRVTGRVVVRLVDQLLREEDAPGLGHGDRRCPEMLAEQPPEMPLPDPQPRGDVVDTGAVAVLEGAVAGVPIEVHRGNRCTVPRNGLAVFGRGQPRGFRTSRRALRTMRMKCRKWSSGRMCHGAPA